MVHLMEVVAIFRKFLITSCGRSEVFLYISVMKQDFSVVLLFQFARKNKFASFFGRFTLAYLKMYAILKTIHKA